MTRTTCTGCPSLENVMGSWTCAKLGRELREKRDGHWAWLVNIYDGVWDYTFHKHEHKTVKLVKVPTGKVIKSRVPGTTHIKVATGLRDPVYRWYPVKCDLGVG